MAEETTNVVEETEKQVEVIGPSKISDLEPKMQLTGSVQRLELYGAFVDIGVGVNAILHISKVGERVHRVSEVL